MSDNHDGLGPEFFYKSIGLLISMCRNKSNRVLWNSTVTPLLLFESLQDLTTVVFAIMIWCHYLNCVKCEVFTDHCCLQHVFTQKDLNLRQWR